MLEPQEILFMGLGKSAVLWYRCALPAAHIGADWVGVRGKPPGIQVMTGLVRGDTTLPHYDDYKVVIIQQPSGPEWLRQIRSLQERGIKVLYEVDDYLHGVPKQAYHDFAKYYGKDALKRHEMCMRVCDGLICSTEYIARRYAKFNRNVYICKNGLDVARYNLTKPERPTVNIGWAGATGHIQPLLPWINAALKVMTEYERTCFITIGQPGLAQPMQQLFGAERALGIPFTQIECYPAAMCMFDIALAPAGNTGWYRGKSDLRWLEAGALGIPVIADPTVYPEIEHNVNGLHADDPEDMARTLRWLVEYPEARKRIGEAAREHVHKHRSIDIAARAWFEVCSAVAEGRETIHQLQRTNPQPRARRSK